MDETMNNPLGTQPVGRLMRQFAVPSVIAMLVGFIYNIVDQFFIGHYVGFLGNSATNVAYPLTTCCVALGLLFGIVVIKFGAPQGIAGIGLQLFGTGLAGSFYRHFIGGAQGVAGIDSIRIPVLSDLPIVGKMLFSCNPMVYFAFLMVPVVHYILFKTPWGLRIRACGTFPRAADSMGIDVSKTRYQALAFGSAMAALAGAYLSLCYAKIFTDTLIGGRGFIAVALVYFGRWSPLGVLGGSMLFSLAQALQLAVQAYGFSTFPYEFLVMLPYLLVVIVLVFVGKSKHVGPAMLGKPFNREMRT